MELSGRGAARTSSLVVRLLIGRLTVSTVCVCVVRRADSLSAAPWLYDDQLHSLPLIEDDSFSHSLVHAPRLDHDDVTALFPMLSDSSLECEGDQALTSDPEQPPFNSDLSPILAAKTAPLVASARRRPSSGTGTTGSSSSSVTVLTPRSKRTLDLSLPSKSSGASRSARKALAPVNQDVTNSPDGRCRKTHSFLTPVRSEHEAQTSSSTGGSLPKRKRTSATEPVLVSSVWSEQEQSLFFSTFKTKWPANDGDAVVSHAPSFSTMLLQRFDAISKRIKTKSVMEVRQFYTNVLGNISVLLREVEHDVSLTNPDQVRIAVWCWSKLLTDDNHKSEYVCVAVCRSWRCWTLTQILVQVSERWKRGPTNQAAPRVLAAADDRPQPAPDAQSQVFRRRRVQRRVVDMGSAKGAGEPVSAECALTGGNTSKVV